MAKTIKFISVDFQKEFSSKQGKYFEQRECIDFVKHIFTPHLKSNQVKIAEIVSDYRFPHPHHSEEACIPSTLGFESDIPIAIKYSNIWVKGMHSPIWIRNNGGIPDVLPGVPQPKPELFSEWLISLLGPAHPDLEVVLIGLTLDCCILCTAQELAFRGYRVKFLVEGVDTYSGNLNEKFQLLNTLLPFWGEPITWHELLTAYEF